MHIGLVAYFYPAWTETFISREVHALNNRGHKITAFVKTYEVPGPRVEDSRISSEIWTTDAIKASEVEVLYSPLAQPAHKRCFDVATSLNLPFVFRIFSGLDLFAYPDPGFYSIASRHDLCAGCVVEDGFIKSYCQEKLNIPEEKLYVMPNSLELSEFPAVDVLERQRQLRRTHEDTVNRVILSIARFVPKKGLVHLVRAFRDHVKGENFELWLVGEGPTEPELRSAADDRVRFLGTVPRQQLPSLYEQADVFVMPSVVDPRNNDADGIATTVFEAMACRVPVVVSDILSASQYIDSGSNGMLVSPGDESGLGAAINSIIGDPDELGVRLSADGRRYVEEHLNVRKNIVVIEDLIKGVSRRERWKKAVTQLERRRSDYSDERRDYYRRMTEQIFAFLKVSGRTLDVGCGRGNDYVQQMEGIEYVGVDAIDVHQPKFPFYMVSDERLPFEPASFDSVLSYSVLQHVENPKYMLGEMARVLKPGGRAAFQVCYDDPNPLFLWWWNSVDVLSMISDVFTVKEQTTLEDRLILVNAVKE